MADPCFNCDDTHTVYTHAGAVACLACKPPVNSAKAIEQDQQAYLDAVAEMLSQAPAAAPEERDLVLEIVRTSDGKVFEIARTPLSDWSEEDEFQLVVKPHESDDA